MQDLIVKYALGILLSAVTGYAAAIYRENKALKAGMQAILRDRMIQAYNHYHEDKGYMPIYAKESFTACYDSYHNLGENGVMDSIYQKIMQLPTSK
mgnify:CR=1 FL=1